MDLRVRPGRTITGAVSVPGDKSIAHRWLILAASGDGTSVLRGLPASEDVRSTARALASLFRNCQPELQGWDSDLRATDDGEGFTLDERDERELTVRGVGRGGIAAPDLPLDCGNSGTTMRLLTGLIAGSPIEVTLTGDASLRARPMERVAIPLRRMGAEVQTEDGHAPLTVRGGALRGIEHVTEVPSAQVKGAILLAGLAASGDTSVIETAPTRDHTERALAALGAPIRRSEGRVTVSAFQHPGLEGRVPGDPSSAAFLIAAAALTAGQVSLSRVGLNPTRLGFVDVMRRMGAEIVAQTASEEVGEPIGTLSLSRTAVLEGTVVPADELPLVIDEVPILAAMAAFARGVTVFEGAGELRVKESDRLAALVAMIGGIGGRARLEGDRLVVEGGGCRGGEIDPAGDHRIAMAGAVAGLAADSEVVVRGAECAAVSFPGFPGALAGLGADLRR